MLRTFLTPVIVLFSLTLATGASWAKSPYKYSIDAYHAEQTLASLSGRPRIQENEWLSIIGERKSSQYRVEPGDTLWGVAKKVFHNPFLWRKLWEVNGFLTNPHEISTGTLLSYYHDGGGRDLASDATPILRIPLLKLLPPSKGLADLDSDSVINKDIKNSFRPGLFVLTPEEPILGEVSGAYIHGEVIPILNSMYVEPSDENSPLQVGKKYSIVHIERSLRDHTKPGTPLIGTLVRVVGEMEVVEPGEHLFKTTLTSVIAQIHRGDKIIALQPPVQWSLKLDPPNDLQTRIVMGEDPDYRYFGQGQLVLLNKGGVDGMKNGFVFRVWRALDPETNKEEGVEPESLGDIQIIYSGQLSAVGYVMRNVEPLQIGDTLVPRQTFSDPPPPKVHPRDAVEIN